MDKEREREKVRASEDIPTERLTWVGRGERRACESPNGTHASFDKLSEHMYMVMSHSNLVLHNSHNIT